MTYEDQDSKGIDERVLDALADVFEIILEDVDFAKLLDEEVQEAIERGEDPDTLAEEPQNPLYGS